MPALLGLGIAVFIAGCGGGSGGGISSGDPGGAATPTPVPTTAQTPTPTDVPTSTPTIGPTPTPTPDPATFPIVYHVLSTGQSLAEGATGTPPLSISQPYSNLMLNRVGSVGSFPNPTELMETNVETPSSGLANYLAQQTGEVFAVSRHGVSGACYDQLRKGTTSGVYAYDHGIRQMQAVKSWAQKNKRRYRVLGVTAIHGECDEREGRGLSYRSNLEQWQRDYEADIRAHTGQIGTIPLFIDQMSSYTKYGRTTPTVAIAQFQAARANPGRIILVGPKYFLPSSDGVHLTNAGYRWLGEYYGKVIKKVAFNHESWQPLSPKLISRQGRVITVRFHVPVPPLQFDTSMVLRKEDYGFEYFDESAAPPSIQNVDITASDTVRITLSSPPTVDGGRLRYAFTGRAGANGGPQSSGSAHGNLRDSDNSRAASGDTLYNWAVHFDEPIR